MTETALGDETLDALVASSAEPLVVAARGTVRLLVFNRPAARNALSRAMRQTYAREMQAAEQDPAITAVIVAGAHGYFSAGADVKENPPGSNLPMVRPHPVEATRAMTKPVIALVDGPCITGGLEVALACSFVLASDRSSFADTHIKIGIFPGWGLASLLSSAIGARRAAQMQMTGEFIDARRAYDWGIVNELAAPEALLARGLELANRIAAYDQGRIRRYVDLNRRLDGLAADAALAAEFTVVDQIRAGL